MVSNAKVVCGIHPTLNLCHPTVESFIWNTIIRAHAQSKAPTSNFINTPLSIFARMRLHGVSPDCHTFPFLLQSLNLPRHLLLAQCVHAQILRFGLSLNPFVLNSLINLYASRGEMGPAQQIFDGMLEQDLPSWNSILNANAKVGRVEVARKLFDRMPERNVISWSCMMDGYLRCGHFTQTLALFRKMQMEDVRPNEFTMSMVLSACGRLGALEHGKWAHVYIDKCGFEINVVLGTSLIDMYSKCGSIERARWVFDNLGPNKDVMAWSAMISGLAMHGHSEQCLNLLSAMKNHGVRPNGVTFLGVLGACVHGGLVTEGEEHFKSMSAEYGNAPSIQHYTCMVDLYGRAGLIQEAWDMIKSMPMKPDVLVWGALLSGSRMHGNIKTCEVALKKLIEMEPANSGAYVLLSNVYAKMGKWNEVRHVRDLMEGKGIKKVPGCSLVEVDGFIHEFVAGDKSYLETKDICMMLEEIMNRLKTEGYLGNTKEALLDLDEEGREMALLLHSEKLAIAFALLKTSVGTPIRIVKNLRICDDCHFVMKMISRVFARDIVVRDCSRFHHFVGGICSCKDYW